PPICPIFPYTTLFRSQKCIQMLPAKHQQVIYLRFYVDDSLAGIAAALGCSVGTVKSRLFHALDKLRKLNALTTQFENPRPDVPKDRKSTRLNSSHQII